MVREHGPRGALYPSETAVGLPMRRLSQTDLTPSVANRPAQGETFSHRVTLWQLLFLAAGGTAVSGDLELISG